MSWPPPIGPPLRRATVDDFLVDERRYDVAFMRALDAHLAEPHTRTLSWAALVQDLYDEQQWAETAPRQAIAWDEQVVAGGAPGTPIARVVNLRR